MGSMMYSTGLGFGTLWMFHVISVTVFFTGIALFIGYAVKTFTPQQLKNWIIWLLVTGTVLCLISIGLGGRTWFGALYGNAGMGSMNMQGMQQMMQMMMEHDEASPNGDHDRMEDMLEGMMNDAGNRQGMMR